MEKKEINTARRNFFSTFGIGALSAAVMSIIPLKAIASPQKKNNNTEQHISIAIDPMAVKRTNKG